MANNVITIQMNEEQITKVMEFYQPFKVDLETLILVNNKLAPKTTNKLNILDPIILLKDASEAPAKLEEIDTLASGALVPIDTKVKPITNAGIFNFSIHQSL